MTRKTFDQLLVSLYDYYDPSHEKNRGEMAHRVYFDELREVPDSEAIALHGQILKNCRYFPTVSEIADIARRFVPEKPVQIPTGDAVERCPYCLSTGSIPYTKRESWDPVGYLYTYHARCPKCKRGERYADWPSYGDLFGEDELERVREKNERAYQKIHGNRVEAAKRSVRESVGRIGR